MNTRIADNVTLCTSTWKKGTGLMFRFPKGCFAYIFPFKKPQRLTITMWFVFYSIDILFLDEDNLVVQTTSLRPFSNYVLPMKAIIFIELPFGTIQKHDVSVGQKIFWSKDFVDLL